MNKTHANLDAYDRPQVACPRCSANMMYQPLVVCWPCHRDLKSSLANAEAADVAVWESARDARLSQASV